MKYTASLRRGVEWLQRQRIHQPAEQDRSKHEPAKHERTRPQLRSRLLAQKHREYERYQEGKYQQKKEVAGHFRPTAMSYASRMTREFKRPETIRKQLPYS